MPPRTNLRSSSSNNVVPTVSTAGPSSRKRKRGESTAVEDVAPDDASSNQTGMESRRMSVASSTQDLSGLEILAAGSPVDEVDDDGNGDESAGVVGSPEGDEAAASGEDASTSGEDGEDNEEEEKEKEEGDEDEDDDENEEEDEEDDEDGDSDSDDLSSVPDTPVVTAGKRDSTSASRLSSHDALRKLAKGDQDDEESDEEEENEPVAPSADPMDVDDEDVDEEASATPAVLAPPVPQIKTWSYPPAVPDVSILPEPLQDFKLARFIACRTVGCACPGIMPPANEPVVMSADALPSEASETHNVVQRWIDGLWDACGSCGHSWRNVSAETEADEDVEEDTGGHTLPPGLEAMEKTRRRKVAGRIEELLQDKGQLLNFEYTDEDLEGLRRQLGTFASSTSGKMLPQGDEDEEEAEAAQPTPSPERKPSELPSPKSDDSSDDEPLAQRKGEDGKASRKMPGSQSRKMPASGAGAGKMASKGKSKQREPISVQRQADGDVIVDDQGQAIEKLNEAIDGEVAAAEAKIESEIAQPERKAESRQERAERVEEASKGLAIDVEDDAAAAKDAEELDDSVDWSQVEFTTVPKKQAALEYETGFIRLPVVSSSVPSHPASIILIGLKNLFQRQLPKMPREYITRLVLDNNHHSMAILRRGYQVVGGICYRPFESRGFAEIVFCAVDSSEQIKGYGAFLMNACKDHVRRAHPTINHFLTYADNYAIGWFKKQGFTKEISLPRDRWVGYIKDYDAANLMMCKMLPGVRYMDGLQMLHNQKAAVLAKIRTISQSHVVRKGLTVFKDRKSQEPIKLSKEEIPGLTESGWDEDLDNMIRQPIRNRYHVLMQQILADLQSDPSAWAFAKPVDPEIVKDYHETIQTPMDLSTMELKWESNHYKDLEEFVRDAKLIIANCRQYNGSSTTNQYSAAAAGLEKALQKSLEKRTKAAAGK